MSRLDPRSEAQNLQASGFLLPPVLSLEDVRRTLRLESVDAVVSLHRREGLPLAMLGERFFVTRQRFQQWLDERADACTSGRESWTRDDSLSLNREEGLL